MQSRRVVHKMALRVASSKNLGFSDDPRVASRGQTAAERGKPVEIAQKALLMTPPSTRSAAPVVADASGLATYATSVAISSGAANRLISEVGRTFSKNSFSNSPKDLPSVFASASTKSPTPRDFVGPGRTQLTVIPVPATASARPRETAS